MGAENYPEAYIDPAEVLHSTELEFETSRDEATVYQQFLAAHPGMNPEQVEARHYDVMIECGAALTGLNPNSNSHFYPNQYHATSMLQQHQGVDLHSRVIPSAPSVAESITSLIESLKQDLPSRETTKNVSWSEEEHKLFLLGMDIHGRGDWKSISKNFVLSRTPSQIASHAQKFFKSLKKRQQNVQEFTATNHAPQQLGHPLRNTAVDSYAEDPAPISPLPMPIDPNTPSFYFQ